MISNWWVIVVCVGVGEVVHAKEDKAAIITRETIKFRIEIPA